MRRSFLEQVRDNARTLELAAAWLKAEPLAPVGDAASVQGPNAVDRAPSAAAGAAMRADTERETDWQFWIQDGPEAVSLRYVITSKDMPGQPQFSIDLKDWQPNVAINDATFEFKAPPGGKRIELVQPAKRP